MLKSNKWINFDKYKVKGFYLQLLFTLLSFLFLIILLIGLFSYYVSYSALMDQISREKLNTLTQTKNSSDTTLKEIEKMFIAKSIDSLFLKLVSKQSNTNYDDLNTAIEKLVDMKNSSRYIQSIYLYLPKNKLIVTSEDGRWNIDSFYDLAWINFLKGNKENYWMATRNVRSFSNEETNVITFLSPIPFGSNLDSETSCFVVNINENALFKLIQDPNSLTAEKTYIMNADGNYIVHEDKSLLGRSNDEEPNFFNKILSQQYGNFTNRYTDGKYLISYIKSDYNRWEYINAVPEKQITKPISNIRLMNIIAVCICVLLGVIGAFLTSLKIYKPLSNVLVSVKKYNHEFGTNEDGTEILNEVDFLDKTFGSIIEKNKKLSQTIQRNETMLIEGLVQALLVNSFTDAIELETKLKNLNVTFTHSNFFVFVICIDNYSTFTKQHCEKDRDLYCFSIKNISEELINEMGYGLITQTEKDSFVVVLNTQEDQIYVQNIANEIKDNIKRIFSFTVSIGISGVFEELSDVNYAYNDALQALKMRIILGGDKVILKNTYKVNKKAGIFLSSSREDQIYNNIKQGNIEDVKKIVDKVVADIKVDSCNTPEEIYQFFYSLLGQAIKMVIENGWSISDIFGDKVDLYRDFIENENIDDMKNWLIEMMTRMSHFVLEKKESKNRTLIENILKYMNANYDKEISLNSTAESVYLSPSYLSRLFKEETGKNFIEYVTDIRIGKSKELLHDTDYKISDIADKVNFGNAQNFIKVFKRYQGMTPGQYRETYIKGNLKI